MPRTKIQLVILLVFAGLVSITPAFADGEINNFMFADNGGYLYVIEENTITKHQMMTDYYDLSDVDADMNILNLSGIIPNSDDFYVIENGKKLFILDSENNNIEMYKMKRPHHLYKAEHHLTWNLPVPGVTDIEFPATGGYLYMLSNGIIHKMSLGNNTETTSFSLPNDALTYEQNREWMITNNVNLNTLDLVGKAGDFTISGDHTKLFILDTEHNDITTWSISPDFSKSEYIHYLDLDRYGITATNIEVSNDGTLLFVYDIEDKIHTYQVDTPNDFRNISLINTHNLNNNLIKVFDQHTAPAKKTVEECWYASDCAPPDSNSCPDDLKVNGQCPPTGIESTSFSIDKLQYFKNDTIIVTGNVKNIYSNYKTLVVPFYIYEDSPDHTIYNSFDFPSVDANGNFEIFIDLQYTSLVDGDYTIVFFYDLTKTSQSESKHNFDYKHTLEKNYVTYDLNADHSEWCDLYH